MIVALILLVVYIILLGVVVWAVRSIVAVVPLDPTLRNIITIAITVISVLIAVVLVLNTILPMLGVHSPLPSG